MNVARNKAIDIAKGEYVLLLDSDNFLSKDVLQKFDILTFDNNYNYYKCPCISQDGIYTVDDPDFVGNIPYELYLKETKKGEYATLIKSKILKANKFFEDIIGGEGITWKLIAKQLNTVRYENIIALIYDNSGEDRLSLKNKNYERLANVFFKDLVILSPEYLKFAPIFLLKTSIKYIIYKILSKLR